MYYGYKIYKNDERYKKFKKQRAERGFDDTETWGLDVTIAKFILPRLKRFKEISNGIPIGLTQEEWNKILDEIIEGFEIISKDNMTINSEKEQRALKLFSEHYFSLWW